MEEHRLPLVNNNYHSRWTRSRDPPSSSFPIRPMSASEDGPLGPMGRWDDDEGEEFPSAD